VTEVVGQAEIANDVELAEVTAVVGIGLQKPDPVRQSENSDHELRLTVLEPSG
jgi:hypothetical protein